MPYDIYALANTAAERIQSTGRNTRFRVVSHYDADGITAAAVICKALYREGFDFHVTLMRNPFTQGIERIKEEGNTHIIFTDMGSGQLAMIKDIQAEILIIDHHQLKQEKPPDHIFQINANQCRINGNSEACGASLAYAVAYALNKENIDLSRYALAGATGDKQYIGGFKGFNKTLVEQAIKHNVVSEHIGLKLSQPTISEGLYYSVEPYYKGLSGDYTAIEHLLKRLKIPGDTSYTHLPKDQQKQLHSALMLHLIQQGCESNILDTVIRTRYSSNQTYGEMEQFADLLDACGKGGYRDLGLSLCLGDDNSYTQAKNHEQKFKKTLLAALQEMDHNGVQETSSYRYFYTEETSLGGVIGGIATNFILDKEKPLLSIAKKADELHISCRGNHYLVQKGLDLGGAMNRVAATLQGHGGGHAIAAGATIPTEKEDQFIKEVELILAKQLTFYS